MSWRAEHYPNHGKKQKAAVGRPLGISAAFRQAALGSEGAMHQYLSPGSVANAPSMVCIYIAPIPLGTISLVYETIYVVPACILLKQVTSILTKL